MRQRVEVLPVPEGQDHFDFYTGLELEAGEQGYADFDDKDSIAEGAVLFIPDSLNEEYYINAEALKVIDEPQITAGYEEGGLDEEVDQKQRKAIAEKLMEAAADVLNYDGTNAQAIAFSTTKNSGVNLAVITAAIPEDEIGDYMNAMMAMHNKMVENSRYEVTNIRPSVNRPEKLH